MGLDPGFWLRSIEQILHSAVLAYYKYLILPGLGIRAMPAVNLSQFRPTSWIRNRGRNNLSRVSKREQTRSSVRRNNNRDFGVIALKFGLSVHKTSDSPRVAIWIPCYGSGCSECSAPMPFNQSLRR